MVPLAREQAGRPGFNPAKNTYVSLTAIPWSGVGGLVPLAPENRRHNMPVYCIYPLLDCNTIASTPGELECASDKEATKKPALLTAP